MSMEASEQARELQQDQDQNTDVYTCNSCRSHVEMIYHCTICDDLDLCISCKVRDGHPHIMEMICSENYLEARKLKLERIIQSIVHACQCRDADCRQPSCQKMKGVIVHKKICRRNANGGCSICQQFIALCVYHAEYCTETNGCIVPLCSYIKQKIRIRLESMRRRERRRINAINRRRPAAG